MRTPWGGRAGRWGLRGERGEELVGGIWGAWGKFYWVGRRERRDVNFTSEEAGGEGIGAGRWGWVVVERVRFDLIWRMGGLARLDRAWMEKCTSILIDGPAGKMHPFG